MPPSETKNRDLSFDLLRGGGVLYIVGYYHIQDVWMIHLPGELADWFARVALALFCFISGYLLAMGNQVTDWTTAKKFYLRRLLRIYPLYFLALVAFVSLGLCPSSLFLPSALLVNTLINWNLLTLWFVSMIFLFYLLTPLYLFRRSVAKTCLLTIGVILTMILLKSQLQWIDPRLFVNFPAFVFGILLTQIPRWKTAFLTPSFAGIIVSGLATGLLIFLTVPFRPQDAQPASQMLIIAWFIATLPGLFAFARLALKILPPAPVRFLATASFVLYLIHRLVYHFGANLSPVGQSWAHNFYYVLFLLPVALWLSHRTQTTYDRWMTRFS